MQKQKIFTFALAFVMLTSTGYAAWVFGSPTPGANNIQSAGRIMQALFGSEAQLAFNNSPWGSIGTSTGGGVFERLNWIQANVGNGLPIGSVVPYAGNPATPPVGYLYASGDIVTVSAGACGGANAADMNAQSCDCVSLCNTLGLGGGSAFIGSETLFPNQCRIPDLRGVFIRGAGQNYMYTNGLFSRSDSSPYDGGGSGSAYNDTFQNHLHYGNPFHSIVPTFLNSYNMFSFIPYTYPTGYVIANETFHTGEADPAQMNARVGVETRPASVSLNNLIKCR